MDPGEWDAIWWYRDMRYLGSSCVDGLSTGPSGFGASHHNSHKVKHNQGNKSRVTCRRKPSSTTKATKTGGEWSKY